MTFFGFSANALTTAIGIASIPEIVFMASANCHPSMTGIMRSSSTKPGESGPGRAANPSAPFEAVRTRYPSNSRNSLSVSRIPALISSPHRGICKERAVLKGSRLSATSRTSLSKPAFLASCPMLEAHKTHRSAVDDTLRRGQLEAPKRPESKVSRPVHRRSTEAL